VRTIDNHWASITTVALSGDGICALSGSSDKIIKVWCCQTGDLVRTFASHQARVTSLALNEDGTRALSSSVDHSIKLWETATGRVLATFTADQAVCACAFSQASTPVILAGDQAGYLHFLRLVAGDAVAMQPDSAPADGPVGIREAQLLELLKSSFDALSMRAFLREQFGREFADSLWWQDIPKARGDDYFQEAAAQLISRGLVTRAFIEEWAARAPQHAGVIYTLLRMSGSVA